MSSASFVSTSNPQGVDLSLLRSQLDISRERMARLFGVSAKTIERWETLGSLPRDIASRRLLLDLRALIELGELVYGSKGLHRFLELPLPAFAGATPFQLIERGQIDLVMGTLAADYEGLGP